MKKYLIILLVSLMLLSFSACQSPRTTTDETPANDTNAANTQASTPTAMEITPSEINARESAVLPLPGETMEFSFLSGAGAWRSILTLHADGAFTGWYLDSEMGSIGDDYPNGTAYVCTFAGKFENIQKIDGYSYSMVLAEIQTEKSVGEEWIEDGILYIASEPAGIAGGNEFVLYLPDTPIDTVSQEFLSWWPYRYSQSENPIDTLSCYGILNVAEQFGFFSEE